MARRLPFTAVLVLQREQAPLADETPVWIEVATIRGAVVPRTGSEARRQGAVRARWSGTIQTWAGNVTAHGITASDRLVWEGRLLAITGVAEDDPSVGLATLTVESGVTT